MNRVQTTVLSLAIMLFASTMTPAATIELAGGPFFPVTDKDDFVESGYEISLGLSSTVQSWLMVALSGGYSHLKTVESITIPGQWYGSESTYDPWNWDLYNISLDARLGWELDHPNRFWFSGGLGWYHCPIGAFHSNTIGVRLGAGGSFSLDNRFRLGTSVRYTYTHFSNGGSYPFYLAGVQAQVFLGFDL